jgi:hypothetical protein
MAHTPAISLLHLLSMLQLLCALMAMAPFLVHVHLLLKRHLTAERNAAENPMVQIVCFVLVLAIVRAYQDYVILKKEGRI